MKFPVFFIVSLILFSCGNNKGESTQKVIPQKINSSIYGNTNFEFPKISENARAEVMHWGAFEDFEEQAKTIMFANVRDEYVFKTIDPALVSEEKSKPKRALIVMLGVTLGGLLGIILVLIRHFFKK